MGESSFLRAWTELRHLPRPVWIISAAALINRLGTMALPFLTLFLIQERGYPTEFVTALTEGGYLGALIPEEYGGAGLPLSATAAILETVQAEGCNGAACHAQMYIMGTILRHGTDEQKKTYLPKIATGELRLQAFGVTEPTSGTDTTSLRTFARREGDKYIVNGQKVWTSRAEHSDLMLLLARTTPRDQTAKRTEGLSTFIVDMRAALGHGLTALPDLIGLRCSDRYAQYDNCGGESL